MAEKFKRWVLSEVLPQICAKGYYIHPDIDQENIDDAKEALAEHEKIIAEYEKKTCGQCQNYRRKQQNARGKGRNTITSELQVIKIKSL